MGKKIYDEAAVRTFLEKHVADGIEGIIIPDVYERWLRNDFTDEEIRIAAEYLGFPGQD